MELKYADTAADTGQGRLLIVLNGIDIDAQERMQFLLHSFNRTKWN